MSDAYARREGVDLPRRPFKAPRNGVRYDCEWRDGVCPVTELRAALAREAALVRARDTLIETQATLSRESDHRFLNNLQMVSSMLSMQHLGTPPLRRCYLQWSMGSSNAACRV